MPLLGQSGTPSPGLEKETEERARKAVTVAEGVRLTKLLQMGLISPESVEAIALDLMDHPEEVERLHTIVAGIENPKDLAAKADRVVGKLEERPAVLNNVILRLLERGHVGENVRYLIDHLDVKVAAPWFQGAVSDRWSRLDLRPRDDGGPSHAAVVQETGNGHFGFLVRLHEEKTGQADTFEDAAARADAILSAAGWVLL